MTTNEPTGALDEQALVKVMVMLEEKLAAAGRTLPPDKKADLIVVMYEYVVRSRRDGSAMMDRLLRLMAMA